MKRREASATMRQKCSAGYGKGYDNEYSKKYDKGYSIYTEMGIGMDHGKGCSRRISPRLMAGILAGSLAVGMLAGCGVSKDASSTEAATATAETAESESYVDYGYMDYGYTEAVTEAPAEEATADVTTEAPAEGAAVNETAEATVDAPADAAVSAEGMAGEMADGLAATGATMEESKQVAYAEEKLPNAEEYSTIEEKDFVSVYSEPLSTFSADVDTASYSNLRRLIRDGYAVDELPEGSVRIEEIINYFSYGDLEEPEGEEPFGVTTQIMPCPWNSQAQLLRIGLKTEEVDYSECPPSNLVFLLDVSGSMYAEDKLPLLQESFAVLAENLTEKDRVSIVTYAGDDAVIIEGVSGDDTKTICKALFSLEAGGSTHGSKGIETAYELAEEYYIEGGNNRVILATDGDLNVGLTSQEELEELISEKKESGVFLSVLGFGTGNIKDNKMETLADKGNGNYAYIDTLREANKVLVEEMSATLLTVCKDVKFQVEFNPAVVSEYRLVGYDNRVMAAEDFDDDTKDAGEIGAGHCVTALYEIVTNEPVDGNGKKNKELKYAEFYEDGEAQEEGKSFVEGGYKEYEWLTISIRYKEPEGNESKLLEYPVGYSSYTTNPDEDFLFAAAAAEFGLAARNSEYKSDASLKHVESVLKDLDLEDEYKEEFKELVHELRKN